MKRLGSKLIDLCKGKEKQKTKNKKKKKKKGRKKLDFWAINKFLVAVA